MTPTAPWLWVAIAAAILAIPTAWAITKERWGK